VRIFTIILLFILGIAALGGGWVLISDPTGESLGIPMALLKGTAFKDYLIPGVILFVFNGLLSLFTLALGLKKSNKYPIYLITQGGILFSWLTIELMINLNFYVYHLHIPLYLISFIFIGAGIKLKNSDKGMSEKITQINR
jgi:hypothetical protein